MGGRIVRMLHTRKWMFAFFMPGFFLGIIYVNLIVKQYTAEPGIFSDYFLEQYAAADVVAREYILYLARIRILPFLLILGMSFTRLRKVSAFGYLLWTGFSSGMLLSMAVLSMGIKGSILCIVGILPQFLFYVPAYVVVLWYCCSYPGSRWNQQKTIFVVVTMMAGIILEAYVNPIVVKWFLGTL